MNPRDPIINPDYVKRLQDTIASLQTTIETLEDRIATLEDELADYPLVPVRNEGYD